MAFAMIILTCIVVTDWYAFHCFLCQSVSVCVCLWLWVRLFHPIWSGDDINAPASAIRTEGEKTCNLKTLKFNITQASIPEQTGYSRKQKHSMFSSHYF